MSQAPEEANNALYAAMSEHDLILRDHLAIDRTVLANERTLLAYFRTALTLFLVGMSFVHLPRFDPEPSQYAFLYWLVGWGLTAAAAVLLAVGYARYRRVQTRITATKRVAPRAEL